MLIIGLLAWLVPVAAPGQIITRLAEVRALSREDAAKAPQVHVRAVIVWTENSANMSIVVADDSACAFLYALYDHVVITAAGVDVPPTSLRVGQEIELAGVVDPGGYAPVIKPRTIQVLGEKPLPEPKSIDAATLLSGSEDAQLVEVEGVVQSVFEDRRKPGSFRSLRVRGHGGSFLIEVAPAPWNEAGVVVDALVRARGIALPLFNSRREIISARLAVRCAEDLIIRERPRPDAFAAPQVKIGALLPFDPQARPMHRRVVTGVVTCRLGDLLYIQEASHGIRVTHWQGDAVQPGDTVQVAAFVDQNSEVASLTNALVRRTGHAALPAALSVTPEWLLRADAGDETGTGVNTDCDGLRVEFVARLENVQLLPPPGQGLRSMQVRSPAGTEIQVTLVDGKGFAGERVRPGCELRLTGVAAMHYNARTPVYGFPQPSDIDLYVLGVQDVALVHAAPFWTNQRLGYAIALVSALAAVLAVWSLLLRVRVMRQSQRLERAQAVQREMAIERQATERERNRLSGDLHDSLQQTLAGLSFQLEAADGALEHGTSVEQHLTPARKLLLHLREEFRETVVALRHLESDQDDVELALNRVAAVQRLCGPAELELELCGESKPLPRSVVTAFVLMTREATVNAVHHGLASRIAIRVDFEPAAVSLTITDNGCGFLLEERASKTPDTGHYGLATMEDRMRRLGASLELTSAPGSGTTLVARISQAVIGQIASAELT
jgi:signal transduction histidine kinase